MSVKMAKLDEQAPLIHIIDDDDGVRDALGDLIMSMDYRVAHYRSAAEFLQSDQTDGPGCIILDVRLPGVSGFELQDALSRSGSPLPIIFMTGFGDIQQSVRGMKGGAVDFLTKPFRHQDMLDAIAAALERDDRARESHVQLATLKAARASLTQRETQVMDLVVVGQMNKQIAGKLGLSEVTVKVHRGSLMRKMGARSIAQLARMAEQLEETPSLSRR